MIGADRVPDDRHVARVCDHEPRLSVADDVVRDVDAVGLRDADRPGAGLAEPGESVAAHADAVEADLRRVRRSERPVDVDADAGSVHHVARARGETSDHRARRVVGGDARVVGQRGVAGDVGADEVAGDDVVVRARQRAVDVNPVAAVSGDEIAAPGRTDLVPAPGDDDAEVIGLRREAVRRRPDASPSSVLSSDDTRMPTAVASG